MLALAWVACLAFGGAGHAAPASPGTASAAQGARIYRSECARCHGKDGQGVAGKRAEPLAGDLAVHALADYVQRTMPDDAPGTLTAEDALSVSAYIHGAFYSAEARARLSPARLELQRLTHEQHQASVADLLAGFGTVKQATRRGGLAAEYFQSKGMNKKERSVLRREDAVVDRDWGTNSPVDGITADAFSVAWSGSLLAPESGTYDFRVRTPNGARLYVNAEMAPGDQNRRDDSDARRSEALIDLWVSSGGKMREATASATLLGGRAYPLRLDFFKFKEPNASVRLEWRPPGGAWTTVPSHVLSPEPSTGWVVIGTPFPADDGSRGYARGSAVSKAWLEAVTRSAFEVADVVGARLDAFAGTKAGATNRVEKVRRFCTTLAARAFRGELSARREAEIVGTAFQSGQPVEAAARRALVRILTAPEFLYPSVAADSAGPGAGRATALALALWDSVPDAALREAAAKGGAGLMDEATLRAQATRMLGDARARAKLAGFFRHWLRLEEATDLSKDPKAYPGFDAEVMSDLHWSLEQFVEEVAWGDRPDFRRLLLEDRVYMNGRLARFYGVEGPREDAFVPVRMDAEQRAGVLTHPLILAAFSYHRSSSPIHRGVFLTRNVLGRTLRPPPMAIEFMDDRFDPSLTMREKVTELTGKAACMGCHATINPLGFSLERFDAVGRLRTHDNRKPVDPVADYMQPDGRVVRLTGARDVARLAAESPEARRGFVRQLFQHTWKQSPEAFDPGLMARLDEGFAAGGCHIRNLWVEIVVRGVAAMTPGKEGRKDRR
jgi:cytochrome c553